MADTTMTLILILFHSLLTSLAVFAVYFAARFKDYELFDEDREQWRALYRKPEGKEVLWWLRYYGSLLPAFWRKPIYACPICMCSVWGLLVTFLIGWVFMIPSLQMLPVYVMGFWMAAGANMLIVHNKGMEL